MLLGIISDFAFIDNYRVAFAQCFCLYRTLHKVNILTQISHAWWINSMLILCPRNPSIFIRRHLILINGKEGASVGRDMFGNTMGAMYPLFLPSREETRLLCINDRRLCLSALKSYIYVPSAVSGILILLL